MSEVAIPPAPEEYANTEEILRYALARVTDDRKLNQAYLDDLRDQIETTELLLHEATVAERELQRLLGGDLYRRREDADGEVYVPDEWPEVVAAAPPVEPVAEESQPEEAPPSADVREAFGHLVQRALHPNATPLLAPAVEDVPDPEPARVLSAPEAQPIPIVVDGRRPSEPPAPKEPLPPSPLVVSQMQAVLQVVAAAGGWLQVRRAELATLAKVPRGSLSVILGHLVQDGQLVVDTSDPERPAIHRLPSVVEPPAGAPEPSTPAITGAALQEPPEPPREAYQPRVDRDAIADAIMGALDEMLGLWPQTLDAGKIATHLGLQHHNIYPTLKALDRAGKLQYVQRPDSNQVIVLPLGASMPHPELTQRQQAVFDFLASKAEADGIVAASFRTIEDGAGLTKGSSSDVLWALQKKDYLEVIHKGDAHKAATYRIPQEHRRKPIAEAAPVTAPVAPKSETAPPKPTIRLPAVFVPRAPKVIPIEVEEIEGPAGNRQLSRLRFGQCKWPLDDPGPGKMNEAMFCAEPCGEHTYCAAHSKIAGQKYQRSSEASI